jgi:predicted DsbA family dithiol-disulfide isomerase
VWCFLSSARLRRISLDFPQIEINHHALALAKDLNSISQMFGDDADGKEEILRHWSAAAAHPDGERINVSLMRSREFPCPYSMPGLLACKAAQFQGGMFDRVQRAHAVEANNIVDSKILKGCAVDIGLDPIRWEVDFPSQAVRQAVESDLEEARQLGANAVPTLIFNQRWVLPGAVPETALRQVIEDLLADRDPSAA